jgi:hypothetical protein
LQVRILRDKVNSSEKEKEKIRKEYSCKMETLKAEAERNNNSLMKQLKSLKGQLDVKVSQHTNYFFLYKFVVIIIFRTVLLQVMSVAQGINTLAQ